MVAVLLLLDVLDCVVHHLSHCRGQVSLVVINHLQPLVHLFAKPGLPFVLAALQQETRQASANKTRRRSMVTCIMEGKRGFILHDSHTNFQGKVHLASPLACS